MPLRKLCLKTTNCEEIGEKNSLRRTTVEPKVSLNTFAKHPTTYLPQSMWWGYSETKGAKNDLIRIFVVDVVTLHTCTSGWGGGVAGLRPPPQGGGKCIGGWRKERSEKPDKNMKNKAKNSKNGESRKLKNG